MKHIITLLIAALLLHTAGCTRTETETDEPALGHGSDNAKKGAHGGRLLTDGELQVEVTIFESGVPPEYRVYVYANGKPIALDAVDVQIELLRFGGVKNLFTFTPHADYLLGRGEVAEPHSFEVIVTASYLGKQHRWRYESYEGRTRIAANMAKVAGIDTTIAAAAVLNESVELYGTIKLNAERVRNISARYPGVIRSVNQNVGARVAAGAILATIESNESLQTYSLTAPISGLITARHANVGEATGSLALFEVADFSSVWAELSVFPRDRARLSIGQSVTIKATDGKTTDTGRINFIAPMGQDNQSLLARMTLDNQDGRWTPGQFITGIVNVAQIKVPVAVAIDAVQTFRDWHVVFLNEGETYQAMPVTLGRKDSTNIEVLSGLAVGQRYVTRNSYLIKADIEKSGASHDH